MRRANLAELATTRFDLIVIGGGINGAAIARDAAMRGLTVCLLEKDDLASGTSAFSSRLIHGGLRYLEHREFGLVRESLSERERLLRNAPHLVTPLPMVVPIYEGARRGPRLIRLGMTMYDLLSYDKSLPIHRMISSSRTQSRIPGLNASGLRASAVYYDAQAAFAERLVVENALSASEHGAAIATYARVTGINSDGAVFRSVTVRDELSTEEYEIAGRIAVNVAGPWVDQVLSTMPRGQVANRFIGATKGSHVVLDRWEGAPTDAIYYESRTDGRPILIIPWNDMIMLGSTDLRYEGNLDRVEIDDAEIDYLLSEANMLFPGLALTPDQIRYTYSGIRPLPYQPNGKPGAITRRHVIKDHAPQMRGLWSIIGGKLTTHRSLAEEVIDKAVSALGRTAKSATAETPLPGAAGVVYCQYRSGFERSAVQAGLSNQTAKRLVTLYGTRAEMILTTIAENSTLAAVIDERSGAVAAEIVFAVEHEMASSLADILLRRTMIAYGPEAGIGPDLNALAAAGKHLGWSKVQQKAELESFRSWIARFRPRLIEKSAP